MNRFILTIFLIIICEITFSQNISITDDDTYTAHSSAMLDVKSLTKGLLIPRLTTIQRAAILTPATGLLVFDTTLNGFYYFNGSVWINLTSGIPNNLLSFTGTNTVYLSNQNFRLGIGTNSTSAKLVVKGDTTLTADQPLFSVVNKNNDTIFAVYDGGVRIYVEDNPAKTTGSKGGFAVGGFSPNKGAITTEYLRVTPDSVRIYVEDLPANKTSGSKGGFAVGGFSPNKATPYNLMTINGDSANVFIGDSTAGFGIANIQSGANERLLNLTKRNYFIGHKAGISNTLGEINTFFGYNAGEKNTIGSKNIFIGNQSGYNNVDGFENVMIGNRTGFKNITGDNNTFIGNASGFENTMGSGNIFIGNLAGNKNTIGVENVFIGVESGKNNVGGAKNIFMGYQSGLNNVGNLMDETGKFNTFIGSQAGYNNTYGLSNTFIGEQAGFLNSVGNFNTILGRWAGFNNNGNFNVFLGCEAGRHFNDKSYRLVVDACTSAIYQKPLIYGEFDNKRVVIAGDNTDNLQNRTLFVKGQAGGLSAWFNDSDKRLKKNINTIDNALDKVKKLRGVNYEWIDYEKYGKGSQMGFIAQEADEVIPEVVDKSNNHYSMSYAPITALLVEAIKEQQKIIESLKKENIDLKAEVDKIKVLQNQIDKINSLLEIKVENK